MRGCVAFVVSFSLATRVRAFSVFTVNDTLVRPNKRHYSTPLGYHPCALQFPSPSPSLPRRFPRSIIVNLLARVGDNPRVGSRCRQRRPSINPRFAGNACVKRRKTRKHFTKRLARTCVCGLRGARSREKNVGASIADAARRRNRAREPLLPDGNR